MNEIIKNCIGIILSTFENESREGLQDTPERVARLYTEVFAGYTMNPKDILERVFDSKQKEMVIVKDIEFYSHCEHHMVPFFGKVHIGYIPNGKVLGLSKFARLVDCFAKRLQIQENLTTQIADAIMQYLQPDGCMIVIEAQHLCMMMRGVEKQNSQTITSAVRGIFSSDLNARQEFLQLIKK
jgi:GTP cyclohydrolase I